MITAHQKIGQLSRVPRWLPAAAETLEREATAGEATYGLVESAKKSLSSKVKLCKLDID